jgi:hypothetical protein
LFHELAARDVEVDLGTTMLAAFFGERAGEAEMEVLARRVHRTMRTRTMTTIDPRTVAFATEEVRFRERLLLVPFLFLKLFHPSVR